MNIFYLDDSPRKAAEYHCDVHVRKMIIETVQMLVSSMRRHGATDDDVPLNIEGKPHRGGYHNHPCTRWVGDSFNHYTWCYSLLQTLLAEYRIRYLIDHFAESQMNRLLCGLTLIPRNGWTNPPQAMPQMYQHVDTVTAYRRYYKLDKSKRNWFGYTRGRKEPHWL